MMPTTEKMMNITTAMTPVEKGARRENIVTLSHSTEDLVQTRKLLRGKQKKIKQNNNKALPHAQKQRPPETPSVFNYKKQPLPEWGESQLTSEVALNGLRLL